MRVALTFLLAILTFGSVGSLAVAVQGGGTCWMPVPTDCAIGCQTCDTNSSLCTIALPHYFISVSTFVSVTRRADFSQLILCEGNYYLKDIATGNCSSCATETEGHCFVWRRHYQDNECIP
jgi:hypothetical protein